MMRNLLTSLVLHGRVETTLAKAKELRRFADRVIRWGKQGDLQAIRQASRFLRSRSALRILFDGLAKRFADRPGGYSRLIHFGARRGDGAPMAAVEYLGYELPKVEKGEKKKVKKLAVEKKTEKAPRPEAEEKKEKKKRFSFFGRKKKEG